MIRDETSKVVTNGLQHQIDKLEGTLDQKLDTIYQRLGEVKTSQAAHEGTHVECCERHRQLDRLRRLSWKIAGAACVVGFAAAWILEKFWQSPKRFMAFFG